MSIFHFGPEHTAERFRERSLRFREITGEDFLSLIHQAFDPARPAESFRSPVSGELREVPAWEPRGCPLHLLSEAIFLDQWDCWLFSEEAEELLS